ncbi:MAG: type II toxin-antitoxin system HigB family toxin [Gammaproteobacteria bacterium]
MDAKGPPPSCYRHTLKADRKGPAEVKQDFGSASILRDGRVVFNIAGNEYGCSGTLEAVNPITWPATLMRDGQDLDGIAYVAEDDAQGKTYE